MLRDALTDLYVNVFTVKTLGQWLRSCSTDPSPANESAYILLLSLSCASHYFEFLFSEMLTLIKRLLFTILHSGCLQLFPSFPTNHKTDSKLTLSCCFPSDPKPFEVYHHQNMEIQTID